MATSVATTLRDCRHQVGLEVRDVHLTTLKLGSDHGEQGDGGVGQKANPQISRDLGLGCRPALPGLGSITLLLPLGYPPGAGLAAREFPTVSVQLKTKSISKRLNNRLTLFLDAWAEPM
jgi:hypothetical protein